MAESSTDQAAGFEPGPALADACHTYDEILTLVTHELRSPAAAIIMTAETLADGYLGRLTPDQLAATRRIITTGRYLADLIGEYLDLVRLDAGDLVAAPVAVDDFFRSVVAPAVEATAQAVEESQMRFIQHIAPDMGPIHCDPDLIRIVLVNLLSNAAKYGRDDGAIRLAVGRNGGDLEIAVRNDGPGFAACEHPRLFQKFSRLQAPELRARKGVGVGLYTCRRIVDLHDGRITAASEHGAWAEFTVSIPQPPEAAAAE